MRRIRIASASAGICGAQLVQEVVAQEVRKTVSIVFCDLKGSTTLGETLDTEALRELLNVYFNEMRAILERHGGSVEKYIGDAIMAVFGLPTLHEDDALRAVRAAYEMQQKLDRGERPARSPLGGSAREPNGREHRRGRGRRRFRGATPRDR